MGPTPAPPQLQVDSIHSAPGVHSSRHCSQGSVCQYSTGCGHSVCSTHQEGFPRQSTHWVSSAVQGELCFTRCRSFLNLTRHPLPYRLRAHGQMQSSKLWMGHRPVSRASPLRSPGSPPSCRTSWACPRNSPKLLCRRLLSPKTWSLRDSRSRTHSRGGPGVRRASEWTCAW